MQTSQFVQCHPRLPGGILNTQKKSVVKLSSGYTFVHIQYSRRWRDNGVSRCLQEVSKERLPRLAIKKMHHLPWCRKLVSDVFFMINY